LQKQKKKVDWAKKAVKHPGAFRSWCQKQGYSKVNTRCINKGKKASDPLIRKRAVLADNFRKMRLKRKKKAKKWDLMLLDLDIEHKEEN